MNNKHVDPVLLFTRGALGAFKGNLYYEIVDHHIPSPLQLAIQSSLQHLSNFTTLDYALDEGGNQDWGSLDGEVEWSRT